MHIRTITIGLLFLGLLNTVAPAALAQTNPPAPDFVLMRVKAGQPRVHFVLRNWEKPGCPSLTPACQAKAYLIQGDIVVVTSPTHSQTSPGGPNFTQLGGNFALPQFNGLVTVDYITANTTHTGYLPASALEPAPHLTSPHDFIGHWVSGNGYRNITISVAGGQLFVSGYSDWSSPSGMPHCAEFDDDTLTLQNGEASVINESDDDSDGCTAKVVRAGRYLFIQDDGNCGGGTFGEVFFTGVYQQGKGEPPNGACAPAE